jgi:CHAT domain-containing protein
VQGLQRAFHEAGARHVLASSWSVSDAATSVLMEEFCDRLWSKNLPPLEALRQAQLVVLKDPKRVLDRGRELVKRGIGPKAGDLPDGGRVAERRSPVAWWGAWVLSGVPGR